MDIRRFLLGEMSEDERRGFEAEFIAADDDLFDRIRVVEDELIEAYLRGTLSAADRQRFQSNFLTTEARRRRVAFAQTLMGELSRQKQSTRESRIDEDNAQDSSFWGSIKEFFKMPSLVFGSLAVVLLIIVGSVVFLLTAGSRDEQSEMAGQITPAPTADIPATPESEILPRPANTGTAGNANIGVETKPDTEIDTAKTQAGTNGPARTGARPRVVTLALFSGTLRSDGRTNELNLPADARSAILQLNLESRDYKTYRAEIVDPDGRVVWQSGALAARNLKVNALVPARSLKPGDYMIKLYGINKGQKESVADYTFRVNQTGR